MQEQLREYRRMKDHSAAVGSGESEGAHLVPGSAEAERKAEKAATALNRVMERKTGLPSSLTHDVDEAKKLAELEEISRRNRIDERLQQARAHLGKPGDAGTSE